MLHFVFVLSLIEFREDEEDFRPIVLCEIGVVALIKYDVHFIICLLPNYPIEDLTGLV
jgi:hypothetical protein